MRGRMCRAHIPSGLNVNLKTGISSPLSSWEDRYREAGSVPALPVMAPLASCRRVSAGTRVAVFRDTVPGDARQAWTESVIRL